MKQICERASRAALKALKILREENSELSDVEGAETLEVFYRVTETMLEELGQAYYAKSLGYKDGPKETSATNSQ